MKYKLFGTQTGLYCSELILGAASFGTRRGHGATAEDARKILTAYKNAGGNVIDTSDQYQYGEAEEIVGDFMAGNRSDFIICTKYTRSNEAAPSVGNSGNHRKAMRQAVEGSLKRLKTDYIDVYMPHFDDGVTPPEEIARGMEDLVSAGKVIYTGLANFPAWKAAIIACSTPLAAIQVEYNLLQTTAARELFPMAKHLGSGMMLYSPLAGGVLTGKYRKGATGRMTVATNAAYEESEQTKEIIDYLLLTEAELGATAGQVAQAWVNSKGGFPIVGARTLDHLQESLQSLKLVLTEEHINQLDKLSAVPLGYPHELLATVQVNH